MGKTTDKVKETIAEEVKGIETTSDRQVKERARLEMFLTILLCLLAQ